MTSAPELNQPTQPETPAKPEAPITRAMLIWTAVIVVVLSFVGAWIGSAISRNNAEPVPAETVTVAPTEPPVAENEIYPAGADIRAGRGAPLAGTGEEGDVYIDTITADVWVLRDGQWTRAGNIRTDAAENLTGEAGAPGPTGAPGAQGAPGTTVILGTGTPDPITCDVEGDIFIDTSVSQYYSCVDGQWTAFGPPPIEPR